MECVAAESLPGSRSRQIDHSIQASATRSGQSGNGDQGDLRNACALWLSTRTCDVAARWLAAQCQENLSHLQGNGASA